jgi:hypothetical protein
MMRSFFFMLTIFLAVAAVILLVFTGNLAEAHGVVL